MTTAEPDFVIDSRSGTVLATIQVTELTVGTIQTLRKEMDSTIAAGDPARLVIDVSQVKFIDSVALGAMVVLLRQIKAAAGRMALVGLSGHCLNVMKVTCMDRIFELYDDVPSALEALAE